MYDIKVDYNRDHVYMYNAQNVFAPTMHVVNSKPLFIPFDHPSPSEFHRCPTLV